MLEQLRNPPGEVVIYDLTTLSPVLIIPGPVPAARLGEGLALLDDVTGDSVPEFAASAPGHGLSVGIEDTSDLIADLRAALGAV